jgi:hypothetical protein
VSNIYHFYDDYPLYPEFGDDSRLSLSRVEGVDAELVTTIFMNKIYKIKPKKKSMNKLRNI